MLMGHLPCTDGGLYTATRYEFRSLPDIRRNLHQRPLKTEESPLHWLNGEMSLTPPSCGWHHGLWDTALLWRVWSRCGGWLWSPVCFAVRRNRGREEFPILCWSPITTSCSVSPDAEFVTSVLVRESKDSPVGDDDKIYYFFMERAGEETTSFFDKSQVARVARVARVCKVGVSPATGSQALLLLVRGQHASACGKTEA